MRAGSFCLIGNFSMVQLHYFFENQLDKYKNNIDKE